MKGIAVLLWLAFAGQAYAQTTIVKCRDAKGQVMYVSGGCEPGQRADSSKAYEPVYDDPAAVRRVAAAEREVAARRATYGRQAQAVYVPAQSSPDGCAAAKANRENVLKAVGLHRTYNLLQQLDEQVRKACR